MKKLELRNATRSLAEYAREIELESLLITSRGKAIAALIPVNGADADSVSLSMNPKFLAIIERSRRQIREGKGIPLDEVRRSLGLDSKTKRPARRRLHKKQ
jgi:hypothetical protein